MTTRGQVANCFAHARAMITTRDAHYICVALGNQQKLGWQTAQDIIQRRICGYWSLYGWLKEEVGIPHCYLTTAALREHRIRWLDRLVDEFSKNPLEEVREV